MPPSDKKDWMPTGSHPVTLGGSLPRALKARKGPVAQSGLPTRDFYSFRYSFKPDSADPNKSGSIRVTDGDNVVVEHPGAKSGESVFFNGTCKPGTERDCVLIFDPQTGGFTLEKVESYINLKYDRKVTHYTESPRAASPPSLAPETAIPSDDIAAALDREFQDDATSEAGHAPLASSSKTARDLRKEEGEASEGEILPSSPPRKQSPPPPAPPAQRKPVPRPVAKQAAKPSPFVTKPTNLAKGKAKAKPSKREPEDERAAAAPSARSEPSEPKPSKPSEPKPSKPKLSKPKLSEPKRSEPKRNEPERSEPKPRVSPPPPPPSVGMSLPSGPSAPAMALPAAVAMSLPSGPPTPVGLSLPTGPAIPATAPAPEPEFELTDDDDDEDEGIWETIAVPEAPAVPPAPADEPMRRIFMEEVDEPEDKPPLSSVPAADEEEEEEEEDFDVNLFANEMDAHLDEGEEGTSMRVDMEEEEDDLFGAPVSPVVESAVPPGSQMMEDSDDETDSDEDTDDD